MFYKVACNIAAKSKGNSIKAKVYQLGENNKGTKKINQTLKANSINVWFNVISICSVLIPISICGN